MVASPNRPQLNHFYFGCLWQTGTLVYTLVGHLGRINDLIVSGQVMAAGNLGTAWAGEEGRQKKKRIAKMKSKENAKMNLRSTGTCEFLTQVLHSLKLILQFLFSASLDNAIKIWLLGHGPESNGLCVQTIERHQVLSLSSKIERRINLVLALTLFVACWVFKTLFNPSFSHFFKIFSGFFFLSFYFSFPSTFFFSFISFIFHFFIFFFIFLLRLSFGCIQRGVSMRCFFKAGCCFRPAPTMQSSFTSTDRQPATSEQRARDVCIASFC